MSPFDRCRLRHGLLAGALTAMLAVGCSDDGASQPAGDARIEQGTNSGLRLCVDVTFCTFAGVPLNAPSPAQCNVVLTNCSTEQATLSISSVTVLGDSRCSFSSPKLSSREIGPTSGTPVILNIGYDPQTAGVDHATVVIESNAGNRPTIAVCGCTDGSCGSDGGNLACIEQTTRNPQCH